MTTTKSQMTAAEFRLIGKSLYGIHWRSKLADLLTRDVRTIRRWGTGESPIPARVAERMTNMAVQHGIQQDETAS